MYGMNGSEKARKGYLDIGINPFRSLWNKIEAGGRNSGKEGEKKHIFTKTYCLLYIQSFLNSLAENVQGIFPLY